MDHDRYTLNGQFALVAMDSKEGKPLDPALLAQLRDRLPRPPLAPATVNSLIKLSRCRTEGTCQLALETLEALFEAILRNPGLQGQPRGQVLAEMTQQRVLQGDLEGALRAATAAVQANPADPQLHLNQANLLIHLGQPEAARAAIDQADRRDGTGFFAERIAAQRQLLATPPEALNTPSAGPRCAPGRPTGGAAPRPAGSG